MGAEVNWYRPPAASYPGNSAPPSCLRIPAIVITAIAPS